MLNLATKPAQSQKDKSKKDLDYSKLIKQEAQLGGLLFGVIEKGAQREFFCWDETNWIWYDKWYDQNCQLKEVAIRYKILDSKIYKQYFNSDKWYKLDVAESQHLLEMIQAYRDYVLTSLYPEQNW
ncbi:MAG: hypothetical protein OXF85_00585 [Candidatus Saccharibacteria bacterium]|nr:hypothetical protein [Candidatus Saccharibacteria bacterium]MCY4010935.1 hypothetical protein [Candidatus Saccharibacteria bacterium]